jgi:antagonist of KipI
LTPQIDGQVVQGWRPVAVRQGSVLQFGEPRCGCRAYLSVAGGVDVPEIMGSRSTYLRAQLGGFRGRALKAGDILNLCPPSDSARGRMRRWLDAAGSQSTVCATWAAAMERVPSSGHATVVRAMRGGQFDWFDAASQELLFSVDFEVTSQSDRMGYRLAGPTLHMNATRELISEAVTVGAIQVPPGGQLIVLMADRPTTGGYPKIANAATVDMSQLAQTKPGGKIRFQEVSVSEAQQLLRTREADFERLKVALALREDA